MSALGMRLNSDPRNVKLLLSVVFRGVTCCKCVCDLNDWSGNKRGSCVVGRPLFKRTVHNARLLCLVRISVVTKRPPL